MTRRRLVPSALIALAAMLAAYFVGASRTDAYLGRWLAWKWSDIDDYKRFPAEPVRRSDSTFQFRQVRSSPRFGAVRYRYKGRPLVSELDQLLNSTGTTAFIVIKNDVILYEAYFNGYRRDSIVTSFSIAKSIASLLVGIASDRGFLQPGDPVTKYIPELLKTDPRYERVTLEHLLNMKSGIAFRDTDFPWGDKPKAYYHPDLRRLVLNLPLASPPGQRFSYNTYNPILLGIVLERATRESPAKFLESALWKRLGMEYDASWSLDSNEDRLAKMESGINARAIDFAKLARLVLQEGAWEGEQIVSKRWIEAIRRIDSAKRVPDIDPTIHYQNGWWIQAPTSERDFAVAAWGHLGQYLYIYPRERVIIARFGSRLGKVDSWSAIFQDLVDQTKRMAAR